MQPKKIFDADTRRAFELEHLRTVEVTIRCFELLEAISNTSKHHGIKKKMLASGSKQPFDRAPEWLRPLASLSRKLGVDHPGLQAAVKAGCRGDWITVDMFLMAHEDD